MASTLKGLFRIEYPSIHQYLTSTGTVLLLFSYLASFGYITSAYSFTGGTGIWQLGFLLIPVIPGIIMIVVGLAIWHGQQDTQNEAQETKIRLDRAEAIYLENQSELYERMFHELDEGDASVDDLSLGVVG